MGSDPLLGELLAGRYFVASQISRGGMATIYCGSQAGDPPHVALKVMHPEFASDSEFVRRFRLEAKAYRRLQHPNVLKVLDQGVDGAVVFLVMELLIGTSLGELLFRAGRVSEQRAARILVQVCRGLQAAHDRGIVHRDLKPENVMLLEQPDGAELVKLVDFGIAKMLDRDLSKTETADPLSMAPTGELSGQSTQGSMLTRVGTMVGTPQYMSPEQGRAESITHKADVYSAGIVLFELITGRVPFDGITPLQVVMRHVNDPVPAPRTLVDIDPRLEQIVLRMLAKWPDDRPSSAASVADSIEALLPALATELRPGIARPPIDPESIDDGGVTLPRASSR